jgi:hypothetical protein
LTVRNGPTILEIMKKLFFCLVLLFSAIGEAKGLGLGFSLGNPTGLNFKQNLDGNKAVDGGIGWSLGKNHHTSIHSDYLFHNDSALYYNDVHPLDLYYGIGGRMKFADDIELGVRLPVGVLHQVEGGKSDVFGEIAPIWKFISRQGIDLNLLIGGRYYF